MVRGLEKIRKILEKQKYAIVGGHSGVQICRWTKNSLNNKGGCWKEKFYGIKSHRCCQMSPALMWCENSCLHCWRPIEMNLGDKLPIVDEPIEIIEGIIKAREKLLEGYKGNPVVSGKKYQEAIEPTLFTFSLSGEPTIYPRLGEMIKELRKRKIITFLVTNGLNPEAIEKLEREDGLPTQITVSCNAPNERLFKIWHRSSKKNAWYRFNETLGLIKKLKDKTRRVIRLTLVKSGKEGKFNEITNIEEENVREYARLIKKAEPNFVHVKGFKSLGFSRERMGYDKQPFDYEVRRFAEKLVGELNDGWKILAEEKRSCVVLLGKSKRGMRIRKP